MNYTAIEALRFVEENDVKFIRLAFCDIFGVQKNISIMPRELSHAFENGVSIDASSVNGFMNVSQSDLFLYPDPATMSILPWRPQTGRVVRFFCDIKYLDGSVFEGDGRGILKAQIEKLQSMGYGCKIGSECEFYLFDNDEDGNPTKIPHDNAGYFDIAPKDKAENVRREICLSLEQMGIDPISSHHEQGPGQNGIVYRFADPLTAADNMVTFKSVVKTISNKYGLHASFMPKPLYHISGNGMHINISLYKNHINLLDMEALQTQKDAYYFIAGILKHVKELSVFLNATTNSYRRMGQFEAPKLITWSHKNCAQLMRVLSLTSDDARVELRSPDPSANPYLAFALLIHAGIVGIQQQLDPPDSIDVNVNELTEEQLEQLDMLPDSLEDAIKLADASTLIKETLPEKMLQKYLEVKQNEWDEYLAAENKDVYEDLMYFYDL